MNDLPDEFGPFAIGEVVILMVDCEPLDRKAGDEVTIDSPYTMHSKVWSPHKQCFKTCLGWLLLERVDPFSKPMWSFRRVLVQHGEVRRKRRRYQLGDRSIELFIKVPR